MYLSELCEKNNAIDRELYVKLDVKRGLRDFDGTGVRAAFARGKNDTFSVKSLMGCMAIRVKGNGNLLSVSVKNGKTPIASDAKVAVEAASADKAAPVTTFMKNMFEPTYIYINSESGVALSASEYTTIYVDVPAGITWDALQIGVMTDQGSYVECIDNVTINANSAPVNVVDIDFTAVAAKAAGADVTHLDSVRQVVTWARGNMEASRLDNIRWIVEDALKFARREAKRGNTYQGIILDPPAYGHGPDGEKWKLDECLNEMLQCVAAILAPQDSFMVLNLYSNGYSAVLGETIVKQAFCLKNAYKSLDFGELVLRDSYGKNLPLSVFVRLAR